MIKSLVSFVLSTLVFLTSCTANQNKKKELSIENSTIDSSVHETKDSKGRVIERWGNYGTEDRNMNFRHFFYYNEEGLLINEKQYWFDDDNKDCLIADTAEYRDIHYYYKPENGSYTLEIRKCFAANYNSEKKFIGRKLYYIYDEINEKYLFRDDSMGGIDK